jgi:hypothetical protein
MNPPKNIFDLAPSTFARKNFWFVKLRKDEIEDLDARKDISVEAKWTWVRLKSIFKQSEQPGWLIENGEPMAMQSLAQKLRRRRVDALEREINELLRGGIIKKHDGFIYDPGTLSDELEAEREAERKEKASKSGVKEELNCSKTGVQLSAYGDSSNAQVVDNQQSRNSATKVQLSGSSSIRSSTTKRSTTTTEAHRSAPHSAATDAPLTNGTTGTTTVPPDCVAYAPNPAELDQWQAEHPNIDVRAVYKKWRKHCEKHGQPISLERWLGWLQRERPSKQPAASATNGNATAPKKRRAAPAKNGDAAPPDMEAANAAREADEARREADEFQAQQAALREAREQEAQRRDDLLTAEARKLEHMPYAYDSEAKTEAVFEKCKCSTDFAKHELLERALQVGAIIETDDGFMVGRLHEDKLPR